MGWKSLFGNVLNARAESVVSGSSKPTTEFHEHGITLNYPTPEEAEQLSPQEVTDFDLQRSALAQLHEAGDVSQKDSTSYHLSTEGAARLDQETAELLHLPRPYPGRFDVRVHGRTRSNFDFEITTVRDTHPEHFERQGAVLHVGRGENRTSYLLPLPMVNALKAYEEFRSVPREHRTEDTNVRLIAGIQQAKAEHATFTPHFDDDRTPDLNPTPFPLDLSHLEKYRTHTPRSVYPTIERLADGSLKLVPDFQSGHTPEEIEKRLGQLDTGTKVLRVDNTLIHLDSDELQHDTARIRQHRRIPAERSADFLKAPQEFLQLSKPSDVFSVRVRAVGQLEPLTYQDSTPAEIDWFSEVEEILAPSVLKRLIHDPEQLLAIEDTIERAVERGATVVPCGPEDGRTLIDISDPAAVTHALESVKKSLQDRSLKQDHPSQDARASVGLLIEETSTEVQLDFQSSAPPEESVFQNLRYGPYPHQRQGIDWILQRMRASLTKPFDHPKRVQGAILADDMGLGKTFMTLVALRQFARDLEQTSHSHRPHLLVVPLTLVANWEQEMHKSFLAAPFDDVVVLHGDGLKRFKLKGATAETKVNADHLTAERTLAEDHLRLSLAVGDHVPEPARLDRPGRLVITTYQTLADYQLSLGTVDWGAVIFDEAQDIKNPEALRTRAAKGLKALFKLVATGTPVENSLRDLWSLLDTAQPGLLGQWLEFKKKWVLPMNQATDFTAKAEIGRKLADEIDGWMLHRTKDDVLSDTLPPKTIHDGEELRGAMPELQRQRYDKAMAELKATAGTAGAALAVLQSLRSISLHPGSDAEPGQNVPNWKDSARTRLLMEILRGIQGKQEKAIIFVISKRVQRHLLVWLKQEFGIEASVINGETATRGASGTRTSLIRDFEAARGFNVIIMSPIAAGRGLTVTGANHAIHLERHWNPAKEAQATDRVYRIGQTKDVHIYLPMAVHPNPETTSFDLSLHRLLTQKTTIKNAVVIPESVKEDEVLKEFAPSR